jgi:hypothetical protein
MSAATKNGRNAMQVLDEYLVKLGFKIEDTSFKNFMAATKKGALAVYSIGQRAAEAAQRVVHAVDVIARQYELLYYTSQRTGAGAGTLLNYSFAATQIGLTAEASRHSVEAFTQALRLNPGLQGLLTNLGVGGGDPIARMQQLVEKLKGQFGEKGYFAAAQVAGMFGMDEQTFRQLWMNLDQLKARQEESADRFRRAGVDADDAAKKFTSFARSMNSLGQAFEVLGTKIALNFVEPVQKSVDIWTKFIDSLSQNKAPAGADTPWIGLGGMLGPGGIAVGLAVDQIYGRANSGGAGSAGGGGGAGSAGGGGGRGGASGIVDYFVAQGWSREQAVGIAANLQAESGFNPAARNSNGMYGVAQWDTQRRKDFEAWSGHSIVGSSLQEQLAFVQYELTQGKEQGAGRRLRDTRTAGDAGYAVGHFYERPDIAGDAIAQQRRQLAAHWGAQGGGGGTSNIAQTNNITVHGVGDPAAAASAVAKGIAAQNQQLRQMIRGDTVR